MIGSLEKCLEEEVKLKVVESGPCDVKQVNL